MPTTQIGIQTSFSGTGAGAAEVALGKVGATATKAERELASYARTVAQSQRAHGDSTGAVKTYESALGQLNRTSKEAISIERQLAATRKAGLGPALPRTVEEFGGKAIDQLKTGLIGIVGPAAVATAALRAIPAAIDLAQLGAQADLVRIRFDSLAASAGMAGDELLAALRKGSGREISDLNLQLAANKAQLLGVAHSADEFGVLMSIARDRAQQMGISTTQAFDDLVTGLGRGSRLILDNLGILVNADAANQAYARSIGKTVAALTDQEKKQALINQVIKDGQAGLAATGGAVESAAAAQSRMGASIDNIKAKLGSLIANGTAPAINSISDLANGTDSSIDSWVMATSAMQDIVRSISGLPAVNQEAQKSQEGWTRSVLEWVAAKEMQLGLIQATPTSSGGGGTFEFADVALAREVTQAQLNYANALAMTGVQQRAAAMAAEQKSTADKLASIDAQTHGIAEQKLADQAKAAAAALVVAGPAGARTAALLANSSSQIDILTAAYYRLAMAQGSAATGATQQQAADFRSMELFGQTAAQTTAALQKQTAADLARSQGILQNGTELQKIAELQRLYNDAVRQSGKDSAQAITAQNALTAAQRAAARPGRGPKGLGALDKIDIDLAGDYQAQLDAVNARLAAGNLNELQRKQLIKDKLSLEEKITDEAQKQARANVDAQLGVIENARKRLDEKREAARLQRALAGGRLSGDQLEAVNLRLAQIPLEQEKRRLDIAKAETEANGITPINGQPVPVMSGGVPAALGSTPQVIGPQTTAGGIAPSGVAAAAPFTQTIAPPVTVNIQLSIADGKVTNANVENGMMNIFLNRAQAGNAGGARG